MGDPLLVAIVLEAEFLRRYASLQAGAVRGETGFPQCEVSHGLRWSVEAVAPAARTRP